MATKDNNGESCSYTAQATDGVQRSSSRKLNIKDIEELIPQFSGKESMNVKDWVKDFEEIASMVGWNEIEKFVVMKKQLTGTAKSFARTLTCKSFKDLRAKLVKEFDTKVCKAEIYLKLQNQRKKYDESFREFCYRMIEMGNLAEVDEQSLIHFIINGINDKEESKQILYNALRISTISTLEELKMKLDVYERIKLNKEKSSYKGKFKNYESNKNEKKIHCFNCGSTEHLRRECKKGTKCFSCNKYGHTKHNCPEKSSPSTSRNLNLIEIQNTKTISMEEQTFQALIDTGSDISIMREDAFRELKDTHLRRHQVDLIGLGLGKARSLGSFQSIFKIDNIQLHSIFHVIPKQAIRFQCILGKDIIAKARVVIENNQINFYDPTTTESNFMMQIAIDENEETDSPPKYAAEIKSIINSYKPEKNQKCPIKMSIMLTDESPIISRPRRLPITEKAAVEEQVKDWLSEGIIRPSKSCFASNVVVVKKKDGSHRVCIDYRRLNAKTVKDHFPVPTVEEVLDKLSNAKVFSKLDLKNGYFHVPMNEDSIKYTAFITSQGQYEFKRVPFGLMNSPAVFLQFIHLIFRELSAQNYVETYMDDLIIPAKTEEENLKKLKVVLKTAAENGLNINWAKCCFLKRRIEFLGHVIENETISPSEEKLEAVKKFPEPKNVKELQAFLGLTGYFRKFMEDYAIIAKPLTDLLQKNKLFKIEAEQRQAIEKLKDALTKGPILHIFNQNAKTEIHTDASKIGCAAVLMQLQADNKFHPVYFYSRKNLQNEQNYHSYTLEVMAVYLALKKFRIYVLGTNFKVVTDCTAFKQTINKKELPTSVSRWIMYMQEFQYEVTHRAGKRLPHVDCLSRFPIGYIIEKELLARIRRAQNLDQFITAVKEILKEKQYNNFMIKADLLFKYEDGRELLVIPRNMEYEIIKTMHNEGHFGVQKTVQLINKEFYIAKLEQKVQNCITNCVKCILAKRKGGKQEGFLHPIDKEDKPLQTLHLDHIGPMTATSKQYKFILTIVDAFSKYVWIYPTKTLSTDEVLRKLMEQQQHFGNARRYITDRGTAFTSKAFEDFCSEENIEHILITTGVPRGNGQVERINKIVIEVLKKLSGESPDKWYKLVPKVQTCINSTFQRSVQRTPFEVLFGTPMRKKVDMNVIDAVKEAAVEAFDEERDKLRQDVRQQIKKIQEENKQTFNKSRKKPKEYEVGDLVAIKDTQFKVGNKLAPDYLGPYEVTRKGRNGRYSVQKCADFQGPKITSTSCDHMKPWHEEEDHDKAFEANDDQDGRM